MVHLVVVIVRSARQNSSSPEPENVEWSKWYFVPTSAIPCHNCVGAVAYVRRKRSLKVKLLSVPKSVELFDFEACLRVSAFQFTRGSALYLINNGGACKMSTRTLHLNQVVTRY
jgi:hypothetical protein